MDYLPYQRIAKQADAVTAEWESLREMVDALVAHRLRGEHSAADRMLAFDLPRRLAVMCDLSCEADCRARVEELFREAYRMAAVRRMVAELRGSGNPGDSDGSIAFPISAGAVRAEARAVPSRRAFHEPGDAEIASMIDDMLSGQRP